MKDWSVNGQNIEASFEFKGFRDAISFIVQIAIEAEVMNHHPEFYNSWNKVSFSFCTHDVGNKITDADIAIAAKISDTARRFIAMPYRTACSSKPGEIVLPGRRAGAEKRLTRRLTPRVARRDRAPRMWLAARERISNLSGRPADDRPDAVAG